MLGFFWPNKQQTINRKYHGFHKPEVFHGEAGFQDHAVAWMRASLTINAPLILKMRDIIFFFAGKLHNGPFQGIFRGGQDFFDP